MKTSENVSIKSDKLKTVVLLVAAAILLTGSAAYAEPLPGIEMSVNPTDNPQGVVDSLRIMTLLTVLSLVPAILLMMTSFTRIVIVLSFVRNALATQQTPPTQVLIGLAMFLTFFVMAPVYRDVNENALQPYLNDEISQKEAFEAGSVPLKNFMLGQTRDQDLALFVEMSGGETLRSPEDVEMITLIPAFMISELKTAFQMGFLVFLPFLVIDMVVAGTLMSMGMFMVPPVVISLPFKLLLFVMADGWYLVVKSLLESYQSVF